MWCSEILQWAHLGSSPLTKSQEVLQPPKYHQASYQSWTPISWWLDWLPDFCSMEQSDLELLTSDWQVASGAVYAVLRSNTELVQAQGAVSQLRYILSPPAYYPTFMFYVYMYVLCMHTYMFMYVHILDPQGTRIAGLHQHTFCGSWWSKISPQAYTASALLTELFLQSQYLDIK